MTKRCWICGAPEDDKGYCTITDCPRAPKVSSTNQTTTSQP